VDLLVCHIRIKKSTLSVDMYSTYVRLLGSVGASFGNIVIDSNGHM